MTTRFTILRVSGGCIVRRPRRQHDDENDDEEETIPVGEPGRAQSPSDTISDALADVVLAANPPVVVAELALQQPSASTSSLSEVTSENEDVESEPAAHVCFFGNDLLILEH